MNKTPGNTPGHKERPLSFLICHSPEGESTWHLLHFTGGKTEALRIPAGCQPTALARGLGPSPWLLAAARLLPIPGGYKASLLHSSVSQWPWWRAGVQSSGRPEQGLCRRHPSCGGSEASALTTFLSPLIRSVPGLQKPQKRPAGSAQPSQGGRKGPSHLRLSPTVRVLVPD